MARRWTAASNQYVQTAPGGLAGVHGWGCIAVMFRRASTGGTQNIVWTGTDNNAGSTGLSLDMGGSDNLRLYKHDGGASSNGPSLANTDRWYIAVCRFATGTVAATFSVWDSTTLAWSHSTGTGTVQNGSGTYNWCTIGSWTSNYDRWDGDMAALAIYRQWVPTDAEVEALGFRTRQAWLAPTQRTAQGSAVWFFDQAATTTLIRDLTGGGANESGGTPPGISANSVPLLGYGAPVLVPSAGTAAPPSDRWNPRFIYMPAVHQAAVW